MNIKKRKFLIYGSVSFEKNVKKTRKNLSKKILKKKEVSRKKKKIRIINKKVFIKKMLEYPCLYTLKEI